MYLICVSLMCILIISVETKCTTSYITTCDLVSDVEHFGLKTWENLLISPDPCSKANIGTLDEVLKPNFFGKAKNIEELFILDKLTGIEPDAFVGLTQITYIKLHKNQIKVIPKGAFSHLRNSVKIDLQYNSIENIVHGLFSNSSIKTINLSHNKLNNIQVDMVNLPSLERLVIKNNDLSYIVQGAFHENLLYLNLAHNSISQLNRGVLEPLTSLKELDLSHNRFKGIALNYGLPNLELLDLSHNEIVGIAEGSFHNFIYLKHLKLNHNLITHLSYNIFPLSNNIRTLHLHYNAIVLLNENFGRILQNLEEFTLSGNPWTCPCLKMVATYINDRNINQPDCDKRYFTVGKSAVCVINGDACIGDELLTKEVYENFLSSRSVDLCSDL